jgi:hypothetical protein
LRHPAGLISAMNYRHDGQIGGGDDGFLIRIEA